MIEEQALIRLMQKEFQIRVKKRVNIFLHVLLCFTCQIVLVITIAIYLVEAQLDKFTSEVGVIVMFCRFICGTILHLSLLDEVTTGMANMKFALNHSYLFQSYIMAWVVGFLQAVIVMAVEIVNIEIILTSENPVDIVYNFIALAVIAEFDDFVYAALRNEPMKILVKPEVTENVLIINHTTSKKCRDREVSSVEDFDDELRPLRVSFKDRSTCNKCLYVQYKCLRTFYVSVYFYFLPFTTIMLSCLIPIITSLNPESEDD